MAGLRKASEYSKKKVVPYTRVSKKRQKSFIKTVPQQKIVKFTMGKEPLFNQGKLPHCLTLVSTEKVQMRHNAFEAHNAIFMLSFLMYNNFISLYGFHNQKIIFFPA